MNATTKKLAGYDRQNIEAAHVVLADPERYPGLMQEWALAVLGKALPAQQQVEQSGQVRLLRREAA